MRDLYIIQEEDSNLFKIGISNDPINRLGEMQTFNPRKLKIIGIYKEKQILEKHIHKICETYRIRGEWFELTRENLFDIIIDLLSEIEIKNIELRNK